MVTLHLFYIFEFAFKAILLGFVLGVFVSVYFFKQANQKWFTYTLLFTLIYIVFAIGYLYIRKVTTKHFIIAKTNMLVEGNGVQIKYEIYNPEGKLNDNTYSLSKSQVKELAKILSEIEWQLLPSLGPPSIDKKIIVYYGKDEGSFFSVYWEDHIIIDKKGFEVSTGLWNYLMNLSNEDAEKTSGNRRINGEVGQAVN